MSVKKIGRYEVVGELGRGAMGVVYKASDPTIGRLVALKVLALESHAEAGSPTPQEVFMREARAAGRLTHPAIVTIHDAFEDPESHSGCIVMEFVEGRTLEKILMTEPALPVGQALDIAHQAAEALHYAHQHQVIHRDLKPANLLLGPDGRVKITDFGIAKITAREGAMRTVGVVGTPSYMSPEQVTGGDVDARSDIFSLGIIQYLMLTGQKPFAGDTAAVMFKIVYEDPGPPSKLKPQLGPGHDYLVLRCLAKDRNKRYASAHDLLGDLEDLQHGRPPRSQATSPLVTLTSEDATVRMGTPVVAPPQPAEAPRKPRPKWLTAILVAALLILGAVLGVEIREFRHPSLPPAVGTTPPRVAPTPATPPPSAAAPAAGTATPTQDVPAPNADATPLAPGPARTAKQTATPAPATSARDKLAKKPAENPSEPKAPPASAQPLAPAPAASTIASLPVPAPTVAPPAKSLLPASAARSDQVVELLCRFDFKEAMLAVSSNNRVIYEGKLKGKKRGGFLRIKGAYGGELRRPITIPGKADQLLVHVVTTEGADLRGTIAAAPPSGPRPALRIAVRSGQLTLGWETSAESTQ